MKKLFLVVFITALIWVWADLALDKVYPDVPANIKIAKSTSPLWVSLDQQSSSRMVKMTLKGPTSKIEQLRRELLAGSEKFEIFFDAEQQKMDSPGIYTLQLLPLLKGSDKIKELGLTVESCRPESLKVDVRKLVEKKLTVECTDDSKMSLDVEKIEPAQINMFVPESWAGEKLKAQMMLTDQQISQAKAAAITAKPYIELAPGWRQYSETDVTVKLPAIKETLEEFGISNTTIGFLFSENMQGKYNVRIINESEITGTFKINATPEAKLAYEQKPFHIILEIHDEDSGKTGEIKTRRLIYNFPREFVCKGEINAPAPLDARFELIPVSTLPAPVQGP